MVHFLAAAFTRTLCMLVVSQVHSATANKRMRNRCPSLAFEPSIIVYPFLKIELVIFRVGDIHIVVYFVNLLGLRL
jgi:hypothetical protein